MNNFFDTAKVTNTYRPDNPRAAKLARQYPGLVKVRRYTDDSGEVKKTIELEVPMHTHRMKRDKDMPFNHCVNPENCNPAAHGNITQLETCSCGATRKVNVNGNHIEAGPWKEWQEGRKAEVVLEKTVERQSVASTVSPFVSDGAVKSIKQSLKDDDWYAVGDGRHTVSSGFQQVEIIQDDSNHDLFRVTVTRS